MSDPISDQEKEIFIRLAALRKARGIKLGKWSIMLEVNALESIDELWESWVRALGKRTAEDNLVEAMVNQHELIRQRLAYKVEQKRREGLQPYPREGQVSRMDEEQFGGGDDSPVQQELPPAGDRWVDAGDEPEAAPARDLRE